MAKVWWKVKNINGQKLSFLKKKTECTDEISISDVNRHKTSLAIIYMCLKMYCYKCTC